MLSAEQHQKLILLEVGAGLDGSDAIECKVLDKITPNIDLIWSAWSDKALVFPRLQYLYAKKQCLDIIEGQFRDLVQTTIGGYNSNQQQKLANLQALNKRVVEDIKLLEAQAQAARPPVMTALSHASTRTSAPGQIDPNSPVYRGDAILRPLQPDNVSWPRVV